MGQGTLTGLAQLVAEELECDWAQGHAPSTRRRAQNLARNRVWGNFSTGGSRGIRESHDYVRKGGAAARMMLVQAAADEWKVPAAECTRRQQRHHARAVGPHARRYGKVAAAAAKLTPPTEVPLKDPKDWKLAGKRARAARHGRQDHRRAGLRHRPEAARHAQRRDQGLPGVRRQGEELRRRRRR